MRNMLTVCCPCPKGRPAHVQNILQTFQFNRAIDTQIGAGAGRQRAGKRDIDFERAFPSRRIDARDLAFDNPVSRVNFCVSGLSEHP